MTRQLSHRRPRERATRPLRGMVAVVALAVLAGPVIGSGSMPAPGADAAGPQRIVSLNLCTDQLLVDLVPRERIAGLTYLARDPHYSAIAGQARGLPVTRGSAEEVIELRPDLIFAGPFSTRETVAILRRLGYRVVEIQPESDIGSIVRNIRIMAAATGAHARGEALARAIEQRLADLPPPPGARPVFTDYDANGYISGEGTLLTAVANAAGFETLGQRLGIAGGRAVSLEQLLVARPDVIDLGDRRAAPALATENRRHPAMRALLEGKVGVTVPQRYTTCGSPHTMRALDLMLAARARVK